MDKVKFQESPIKLTHDGQGKIGILTYEGEDDPVAELDAAVSAYVKDKEHIELVDINIDNPWLRVIATGINEMEQRDFDPKRQLY